MPVALSPTSDGIRIALKVVPGASRDRVVGVLGNALKLAVSTPPEAGAANRAVVRLLADTLAVSPNQIDIVKGHTSPRKEAVICGVALADLQQRIAVVIKG